MMHNWGGGYFPGAYSYGFPWGGFVMTALLVGLVVFAVVVLVRSNRSQRNFGDPKERGLEILVERFAKGEIDADTFRSMKAELDARN
jgi:putative membrane protein